MPEINLVDKTIEQYANHTEIALQLSFSSLSFCVYRAVDNLVVAFRHYKLSNQLIMDDLLSSINKVISQDDLLRLPHQKAKVIFINRKSTMVPEEFFKAENLKKLMEFNQPVSDLDEIHFNTIEFCNARHVFTWPTYLAGLVSENFKNTFFYNQATPLLCFLNEISSNKNGFSVMINLNGEFFDIGVMQDSKLIFYNNFIYSNSTDLLYFILYVCQQLNIDKTSNSFYLTGENCLDKKLTGEVHKYLKNLKMPDHFRDIRFAPALQEMEYPRFATLINLVKCGS